MFKVMTWNVENLFQLGEDDGPTSAAVYEDKLQGLAATINSQSPDALALQEIGVGGSTCRNPRVRLAFNASMKAARAHAKATKAQRNQSRTLRRDFGTIIDIR